LKILVTGSTGFIGKNLVSRLNETDNFSILCYSSKNSIKDLKKFIHQCDAIIHLAGENRPKNIKNFRSVNVDLTQKICDLVRLKEKKIPIIFTSSTQYNLENPYGKSKKQAEKILNNLANDNGNQLYIYRLPGVFGKWCRPNYNSVVATFCFNLVNDIPIKINDPDKELSLVYIDDVISEFIKNIQAKKIFNNSTNIFSISPIFKITIGKLASKLKLFKMSRSTLILEGVGTGLNRALYSTFISYLDPKNFSYQVPVYGDNRGDFIEFLKTKENGQFSFFTALPGITRGQHYHHTKTEKFLVINGIGCFKFRNISTNESYEIIINSSEHSIVDSIPGWAHEISNIGSEILIVMLWANEIFDKNNPDTFSSKV
jgi:UDP-2-acetamido-2,6-beta-L-arabino-hexul-4-ose reductase